MNFEVIPAIDLKDHKVVQLQQGDFSKEIVRLSDPSSVAEKWISFGAEILHIVDLNGAVEGSLVHEKEIMEIREKFPEVVLQVGGGIRDLETAESLLDSGIDRIIMGTIALKKPEIVEELAGRYEDRIVIAIDSKNWRVVVEGWRKSESITPTEVVERFKHLKVLFLFTNVDVEGLMKGIDLSAVKKVLSKAGNRCIISGGITTYEDVIEIKRFGAKGVVIGSAIYTGKLDLRRLIEISKEG